MSLFDQPSRAKSCNQPKLNHVKQAEINLNKDLIHLETLEKSFDEALLADDAKLNQLEQEIAKQQKKVAARQKKLSQLKHSLNLAVETAQPLLLGLKNCLIQRLIEILKSCNLVHLECLGYANSA